MRKIVFVSNNIQNQDQMIPLIKIMFPECEIHIVSAAAQGSARRGRASMGKARAGNDVPGHAGTQ